MLKMIYMLCFTAILVGCSMGKDELEALPLETSPVPTRIVTSITNAKETNTHTATTNNLTPQYIDESKYEGDELGIVKTLNNMVKAVYEKDINAYNSLITGDMNPIKGKSDFKKHYLSIDKLDFTVKPDPTPPDGVKPVVLEYTEKIDGYEEIEKDKQLFVFQFQGETWKLLYIADWW
ncbi:hypothetical protein [Paenibacillus harenae]|uniref:Uncharacterized protein n=1 Tax=Paenibacillus harenae TaxID=306543 RepID=A0ABT9UAU1_PAEHA|nr:hypothetical protein [Paenibacillus harenae]MDQ0116773.1 hypothetical protein [Paenibacillus harenae]